MTAPDQPCIFQKLSRIAGLASRAYGLDGNAAQLMIMQIVGSMAAGTVNVRGIDGTDCTASFDLALVCGERALVHGAQMAVQLTFYLW